MATFLISDTDGMLIANWNATVRPNDAVLHLGDFAHRYSSEKLPKLFASLTGRKILIRGNHDDAATLALPWESFHDVLQRTVLCHRRTDRRGIT